MTFWFLSFNSVFLLCGLAQSSLLILDFESVRREVNITNRRELPDQVQLIRSYKPFILCSQYGVQHDITCNLDDLDSRYGDDKFSNLTSVELEINHPLAPRGFCTIEFKPSVRNFRHMLYDNFSCLPPLIQITVPLVYVGHVGFLTLKTELSTIRLLREKNSFRVISLKTVQFSGHRGNLSNCVNNGARCLYINKTIPDHQSEGPQELLLSGRSRKFKPYARRRSDS